MIKIIKNAEIYSPEYIGKKDILVIADKIVKIADKIDEYDGLENVETFDFTGKIITPGYIDMHVHITGGGGEQGPISRVPESYLTAFTTAGITTVLGLLGTDGVTRSIENLVYKARALNQEGITCYALTGSYEYPSRTYTGRIEDDIMMLDVIVGVKIAMSDHRGTNPTVDEFRRVISEARLGGVLSAKPGLTVIHMGKGHERLKKIVEAVETSDVPKKNVLPTHLFATQELMEEGAEYVKTGGYIDFTTGVDNETMVSHADRLIECMKKDGVTFDHVSLSTDAFGSRPKWDDKGNCVGITYGKPDYLHKTLLYLVDNGFEFEDVLKLVTTTPAFLLGKEGVKGCIKEGADADILVLDEDYNINSVFAKGKTAILDNEIIMKGTFED